ncbi:ParA family protein [Streptococcus suis]|uniref:Plasmid partition protein n=1 Tax=Streptococcus suis TaxID=1307 RepID=A0A0Z8D2K7_STRSU|nr:ParA family protein [Streptococcus suis]MCK3906218.1 AAA family ATPase [Streptococcus suis]MCK3948229.1 AAA family ATPase [Streptococcus suis]MCK3963618.1 AAA family ATPase [Streptococcus suis]MCK4021718.1 AAA family ATPase [Streptococcus suis]MCK4068805.1 AAA family ATPase [Streptococcus suis]
MRIVSFAAIKGGVGKTTLAFNFGEYLASTGKNVLFLDLDHQCNLSQIYNIYHSENTVGNVFLGRGEVSIVQVKENVALIPGSMNLDWIEASLEHKTNKDMLLYMWLEDNYEKYNLGQFDYIIIDCRPDFSIATKNAIAVSHSVISPVIPSDFGYQAKFNIMNRIEEFRQTAINFQTRESYITAKLLFVANMIKHNTNSSRELLERLESDDDMIGIIPAKELFNRSTLDKVPLAEMKEDEQLYHKHKKFFDGLDFTFAGISDRI